MDINTLLGLLQVVIGGMQLKLDHFNNKNNQRENQLSEFDALGEAIRTLEYALSETISYIGQNRRNLNNPHLSQLWDYASLATRSIPNGAELADIAFEKSLYWRNPNYLANPTSSQIYRISLTNVLEQLRKIRVKYDKIQNQINSVNNQ